MTRDRKRRHFSDIPVIDIFAGPGGLGEGFASLKNEVNARAFRIKLSVEMDKHAHQTLLLRSFFRQFEDPEDVPEEYYDYIRWSGVGVRRKLEDLLDSHAQEGDSARQEARRWELGSASEVTKAVDKKIASILKAGGQSKPWVLVGGPPCQAYSLVGRARMLGPQGEAFYKDRRHTLYREYLRILAKFKPSAFVMENVKGLLSATSRAGDGVLDQILKDLRRPEGKLKYKLFAVAEPTQLRHDQSETDVAPADFVVRSELFGVPQARHRLIILGVRVDGEDADVALPRYLKPVDQRVPLELALTGLPRLRSGVSRGKDSEERWCQHLAKVPESAWFRKLAMSRDTAQQAIARRIKSSLKKLAVSEGRGRPFVRSESAPNFEKSDLGRWLVDPRLGGICNHETRSHRADDLERYLFASAYAAERGVSPKLQDFPTKLLPRHANVGSALDLGLFNDRFRVQLASHPSTTITSHISKDGHYFIHPDPTQCRSLTVREAARLQTFPDNYFFEGPRTEQYHQVGNAVPPLLARQIASIVYDGIRSNWRKD